MSPVAAEAWRGGDAHYTRRHNPPPWTLPTTAAPAPSTARLVGASRVVCAGTSPSTELRPLCAVANKIRSWRRGWGIVQAAKGEPGGKPVDRAAVGATSVWLGHPRWRSPWRARLRVVASARSRTRSSFSHSRAPRCRSPDARAPLPPPPTIRPPSLVCPQFPRLLLPPFLLGRLRRSVWHRRPAAVPRPPPRGLPPHRPAGTPPPRPAPSTFSHGPA